jgi:hypothetical protein
MSQSIALLKRQGHLVQTWPMGKLSVTHRAALKDIGPLRPRLAATYALSSVRLYSRSACLAELQICLRQSLRIAIYRSWRTIKATRECVSILVLERCMVPPHSTVVKSRALARKRVPRASCSTGWLVTAPSPREEAHEEPAGPMLPPSPVSGQRPAGPGPQPRASPGGAARWLAPLWADLRRAHRHARLPGAYGCGPGAQRPDPAGPRLSTPRPGRGLWPGCAPRGRRARGPGPMARPTRGG